MFAAFDTSNGKVTTSTHRRHRATEFLKFLTKIDTEVPDDLDVHLVCDNYESHRTLAATTWLTKHPRFHMHNTPTYSSWLNQVERWFGYITDQLIRHGDHRSVQSLEADIKGPVRVLEREPETVHLDQDGRGHPDVHRATITTNQGRGTLVSFTSVVGCGTAPSNPIRQNRRQVIDSATSRPPGTTTRYPNHRVIQQYVDPGQLVRQFQQLRRQNRLPWRHLIATVRTRWPRSLLAKGSRPSSEVRAYSIVMPAQGFSVEVGSERGSNYGAEVSSRQGRECRGIQWHSSW